MSDKEEKNDSPAFRLRPRRGPPKSYYEVRLEYSSPIKTKSRNSSRSENAKRIKPSQATSSSIGCSSNSSLKINDGTILNREQQLLLQQQRQNELKIKLELEREEKNWDEKRLKLMRDQASSITVNGSMGPFMERLKSKELKAARMYPYNYILLRVEQVVELVNMVRDSRLECLCEFLDDEERSLDVLIQDIQDHDNEDEPQIKDEQSIVIGKNSASQMTDLDNIKTTKILVHLYNEYSNLNLIKPGKILGIGKFRTGTLIERFVSQAGSKHDDKDQSRGNQQSVSSENAQSNHKPAIAASNLMSFVIIVSRDSNCLFGPNRLPLIPLLNISDRITEQVVEPYVEDPPPSPRS